MRNAGFVYLQCVRGKSTRVWYKSRGAGVQIVDECMFGLVCQSLSGFLSSFRCVMAGSFFQEATILESHGIDVQSPGGHSNSDDIDGNDYTEQVRGQP